MQLFLRDDSGKIVLTVANGQVYMQDESSREYTAFLLFRLSHQLMGGFRPSSGAFYSGDSLSPTLEGGSDVEGGAP